MWSKFLQWLGTRSRCCNAPTVWDDGWNRMYCSKCGAKDFKN